MNIPTPSSRAALFGLLSLLLPFASYAEGPAGQESPKPAAETPQDQGDGLAAIAASLAADKDGLATALASDVIRQVEERNRDKYPPTPAGKARKAEHAKTLLGDIKAQPQNWAAFVVLEQKLAADQLTPAEKKTMDDFIAKVDSDLGSDKVQTDLVKLAASKKGLVDALRGQIDEKKLATKAGQDELFEKLRGRYALANPGAIGTSPVASGPKTPIVAGENQIIRQLAPGDPYLYEDGAFQFKGKNDHRLAMQMRGNYEDKNGLYAYIADVNNSRDVRGMTIPLVPGTDKVFELHGSNYKVTVTAEKAGGKDDLVVHVYALDDKGNPITKKVKDEKGKETAVPDPLEAEPITVYGADGLMAKAVNKAVNGHLNADGTRERYVAWLGEGENRRKYIVVPQGGATAGCVYYDAEKLMGADGNGGVYAALRDRTAVDERDMKASFSFAVAQSVNGQAAPLEKDKATVVEYAGSYYQYQWNDVAGGMELKKVSKPAPPKKEGGGDGKGSGGKDEEEGGGGEVEAGADPDWPVKLKGPLPDTDKQKHTYKALQHPINKELKAMNADYRIYASEKNAYYVVPAAIKDETIPQKTMDGARLPAAEDEEGTLTIDGPVLVADTEKITYLFDVAKPLTLATLPKKGGKPDLEKVDMAFKGVDKAEQLTLKIYDLRMLGPALKALEFSAGDIKGIQARAGDAAKDGKLLTVQGAKTEDGQRILVRMEGKKAVVIWPKGGKAPAPGKEPEAPAEDSEEPAALVPAEQSYGLGDYKPSAGGAMEDSLPLGGKTLTKDFEDPVKRVAVYCDRKPCPKDRAKANWYVRWHPMTTKGGKALKDAKFPTDFVLAGKATAPKLFSYKENMGFNALLVDDEDDLGHLILRSSDPVPGHGNAAAFYLAPYDDNHKHEMFLCHGMYSGTEPPVAEHQR